MELQQFSRLYERIQQAPSILLLGQNFLCVGGESDPIWHNLATNFYPELHLSPAQADYPALWEAMVRTPEDAQLVMTNIEEAHKGIEPPAAMAAITKLRWSLLFTSSIDDMGTYMGTRGHTPRYPNAIKTVQPAYLNKNQRNCICMCGGKDCIPYESDDDIKWDIQNCVGWIPSTYLDQYGVLVIDGFVPGKDWLEEKTLFPGFRKLPQKSIFWFGAPTKLAPPAQRLVDSGIMVTDPRSLFEHLHEHVPELFEDDNDIFSVEEDPRLNTSLTLHLSTNHPLWINRAKITEINGSNLCVITDEIMSNTIPRSRNRGDKFTTFLTQEGLPMWALFNDSFGERSFYIPRTLDKQLEESVKHILKENTSKKPILLFGPSNSGKSMTLANLALKIARLRKYPVIYIRGNLLSGSVKRLETFIQEWLCNTNRLNGERLDKIVVFWDGSGLERTRQDYSDLQKRLFNYNVQVIGSLYCSADYTVPKNTDRYFVLPQDLSPFEMNGLRKLLNYVDTALAERFEMILKLQAKSSRAKKNTSILYLLQMLFKHNYDPEYMRVRELMANQFDNEQRFAENQTAVEVENYLDNLYDTQERITSLGIASAFQEQLALVLARMKTEERKAVTKEAKSELDEKKRRAEKLVQLQEKIRKINGILAVSSEFGIALPMRLVLKFLTDDDGNPHISVNEETNKIINILQKDTLLKTESIADDQYQEDTFISYRNSAEAEQNICLACGMASNEHTEIRKHRELRLLRDIIAHADSLLELKSVLQLVRQFGPNGHGMLSELDERQKTPDYLEYKPYWLAIANDIIEKFPEDPETILIYAHLTREYFADPPETFIARWEDIFVDEQDAGNEEAMSEAESQETASEGYPATDYFADCATFLASAIQNLESAGLTGSPQYARLSVEMCANYQQHMRKYGYDQVKHKMIKERIHSVFAHNIRHDGSELRSDFSTNYLLDILINAYNRYRFSIAGQEETEESFAEYKQIRDSIDDLLNLDDLMYERNNLKLIKNINAIHEQFANASAQEKLKRQIDSKHSDILLYLEARSKWHPKNPYIPKDAVNKIEQLYFQDYYTILHSDVPHQYPIPARTIADVRAVAKEVENYLLEHMDAIEKNRSARCVEMLLRAKWFAKTGNVILTEKQAVSLTRAEWDDIKMLCEKYIMYVRGSKDGRDDTFAPAHFLRGVYEWLYGNIANCKGYFNKAKECVKGNNKIINTDTLILCAEGTSTPRIFGVQVERQEGRKYRAKVIREFSGVTDLEPKMRERYNLHVSDAVVKYLFDGMPKAQVQVSNKRCVIRFNLIGAQIGIPQNGGDNNG